MPNLDGSYHLLQNGGLTQCFLFVAGWRGYGCSDGAEAASTEAQLEEALLLTLSNLFFFPAIILALYRRFYAEALVYFCTMFFSSVSRFCFLVNLLIFFCCLMVHSLCFKRFLSLQGEMDFSRQMCSASNFLKSSTHIITIALG